MQNIFVYGTLLSSEIVIKLTGKSFKTFAAVLPGYQLYRVKERDYPAIIQNDHSETKGLVFENADDLSLAVISFYEGHEYKKKKVTVFVNGKPEVAMAFVWVKGCELLDDENWDFQEFEKESLEHYLNVVIPETLEEFYKK
jgi:gamma-glutamylcyclotransferase (GGCT)/AIG2-like uncharacterized protein YtfP